MTNDLDAIEQEYNKWNGCQECGLDIYIPPLILELREARAEVEASEVCAQRQRAVGHARRARRLATPVRSPPRRSDRAVRHSACRRGARQCQRPPCRRRPRGGK